MIFEKADPANRMTVADFVGPSGAQGPLMSPIGEPILAGKEGLDYPMRFTPPMFEHGWQIQRGTYLGVRLRFCRQAHFMEVEVDPETGEVDITKSGHGQRRRQGHQLGRLRRPGLRRGLSWASAGAAPKRWSTTRGPASC